MAYIRYRLEEILDELDMNPNQLAIEAKLLPSTVYKIHKNDMSRIQLQTLTTILVELNRVAKNKGLRKTFDISDLLEFIDK